MPPKIPTEKAPFSGRILAVQPRIRLLRSFDQRQHSYLGYVLRIHGIIGDAQGEFLVAVGKAAHKKHQFQSGMSITGLAVPVPDPRLETAGYYKVSAIKVEPSGEKPSPAPPFTGPPPDLETYRERGHRRLASKTYDSKCATCIYGCRMPTEMIVDQWNPSQKKYRFETFCYGPKSCPLYRPGPQRKVPGRRGMSYTEEDWVDEEDTAHRGPED